MKKPTEKEIETVIKELHGAMVESIEAGDAEKEIKIRKQKAHYRLLKAKEALRDIEFN